MAMMSTRHDVVATDAGVHSVSRLSFRDKVILAPMVRVSTLPTRILALEYGADIVYCEEIIDHKMLKCRRVVNVPLGTVDYVDDSEDVIVFRTCERERERVVFQIVRQGTCDAQRALQVAQLVEQDVAAIDVNMGCPKEFSIKGGMGAALLNRPDRIKEILTTLVGGISKPVTCKIRILPELEETVKLCRLIEETGVAAIAVHGRTKDERAKHANHDDFIQEIARQLSIPVIANGASPELKSRADVQEFRRRTSCSSVMIARAAEWNCSIFRPEGKLNIDRVIVDYLKFAIEYDNHPLNIKYNVQQMLQDSQDSSRGRLLLAAKEARQICQLWNLEDHYDARQSALAIRRTQADKVIKRYLHPPEDGDEQERLQKRPRSNAVEEEEGGIDKDAVTEVSVNYIRRYFEDRNLPKPTLLNWATKMKLPKPLYKTVNKEKLFKSTVFFNGRHFAPTKWERNRKSSEQAAALAVLSALGIHTQTKFHSTSSSLDKKPVQLHAGLLPQ